MSHYLNPLHAPVPSELHSQYTALCHANPPLEPPFPTSLPPSFKRAPQTPKYLPSSPRSGSHVPIIFELIGAPSRGLGIPMRELVVRSGGALERMIVDASESVGYLMSGPRGIRTVSLRIMWPGYEHLDWSHTLELFPSDGPVTRGELAVQIAFAFSEYVSQMAARTPSAGAANWRLGSRSTGGIAFDRMVLIALWNSCDDNWMAEVYVDSR
ncbi:hypothetical protein JVT61DRAFT_6055 [Boletus reticuloceps]|uniref:Uncharacterized protein n=1 Tax=Boletus reticuloceps TaxID=495285 RepID=A0A8I2YLE4_9AGAM|nr:hypothetical protein JVT61DRAFT_6055 [Boletus reticuloceps]